jgi:predicted O-linked N-acetylglucosamine transferase (SPINDLY family)
MVSNLNIEDREKIEQLISAYQNDTNYLFKVGLFCATNNKIEEAILIFNFLISKGTSNINIPYNLGLCYALIENHDSAIKAYDLALQIDQDDIGVLINKGSALVDLGDYTAALSLLDQAIKISPNYSEAWLNKGVALNHLRRYKDALLSIDKAIQINNQYVEAWSNRSISLRFLKSYAEALASCDKAISYKKEYAEAWVNRASILNELKRFNEAINNYENALAINPKYAKAMAGKGVSLHGLQRFDEALQCYEAAICLKPDYAEAWVSRGIIAAFRDDYEKAVFFYDKALSIKSNFSEAWINKGLAQVELKNLEAACADFRNAFACRDDIYWLFGLLTHVKMKICDWTNFDQDLMQLEAKLEVDEKVITPFPYLALTDNLFLSKKITKIFTDELYPENCDLGIIEPRKANEKIRVAYFSADFKNHPVSNLAVELFELHNRKNFEIFAFSVKPAPTDDLLIGRIKKAFDHFIEVDKLTDKDIAILARKLNIDIAIDLGGHTKNGPIGIFAYRAAPLQVNYLGYPGTLGSEYYEYIIADKMIIPQELKGYYSEKIIYLPDTYQANDRKRVISEIKYTKDQLGLPAEGFVYCCFNNNYKILPSTFNGWMRILKAVEGSVLWLFEDNSVAAENLKKQAMAKGVNPERLIFAKKIPMHDHLARYRLADLFLDTFPYNAHTTASDALWAGLPVLTLRGRSFASRVAASLLQAISLPELITDTQSEYENEAIKLAVNPEQLITIRSRLMENRLNTALFNTPLFTKNIESAYMKIYDRHIRGLAPIDIDALEF